MFLPYWLLGTDADAADLLTSDCDPYDSSFLTGERTAEGFSVLMRELIRPLVEGLLMPLCRFGLVWRLPRQIFENGG